MNKFKLATKLFLKGANHPTILSQFKGYFGFLGDKIDCPKNRAKFIVHITQYDNKINFSPNKFLRLQNLKRGLKLKPQKVANKLGVMRVRYVWQ
jgi:hypothetical protein